MNAEIIDVIRRLVSSIRMDGRFLIKESTDTDKGQRLLTFKKDKNEFTIIMQLNLPEMFWEYTIYKNDEKLNEDDILLLYAEINSNIQMAEIE